jgi:hypothetical protein
MAADERCAPRDENGLVLIRPEQAVDWCTQWRLSFPCYDRFRPGRRFPTDIWQGGWNGQPGLTFSLFTRFPQSDLGPALISQSASSAPSKTGPPAPAYARLCLELVDDTPHMFTRVLVSFGVAVWLPTTAPRVLSPRLVHRHDLAGLRSASISCPGLGGETAPSLRAMLLPRGAVLHGRLANSCFCVVGYPAHCVLRSGRDTATLATS